MKIRSIDIIKIVLFFIVIALFPTQVKAVNDVTYLSEIPYDSTLSKAGWGSITMNKTTAEDGGNTLSLIINGRAVVFKKGIFAHAESTIVYDISAYDYDYFTTYYGVSSHRGKNGNVKISIYTSNDKVNWTLETEENPPVMTGATEAKFVKIPIKGKKYIKLYADKNGSNAADHAIYCDAKLIKEGHTDEVTRTVESYDAEIKEKYSKSGGVITDELELLILQREFVYQAGSFALRSFVEDDPEVNQEKLNWLLNDKETLKLFLVGGKPKGAYTTALEILYRMYDKYKEDWNTEEVNAVGVHLKDVYRTMMIASALEHSGKVYLWINGAVQSTPETRYEIYRKLYQNDLIESRIFETLTVEEMRWVINTIIDDNEIEWLNNYTRTVKKGATGPYSYITYKNGYNYSKAQYYDPANYDKWNEKYGLSEYNVEYQTGKPKLWIVFEEGAVCGGLSKTGACVWGSYKGLPNTCVCQPGHCAYAMYSKNANGEGVWNLGNNVGGWGPCGNTEQLNSRMMNDWRATEGGWAAPYILLAQAAQNEYKTYEKAQIQMMLARVYDNETVEVREKQYRDVLETEKINFGAWESLIGVYTSDSTKTESDYISLAGEIIDALTYYPKPMTDLLAKIERKLSTPAYLATFNNMKTTALKTALANANKSIQATAVREVSNYLLGLYDSRVATFAFDGENANSIVLGEKYKDSELGWDYSFDDGKTWTLSDKHIQALTDEQIDSITAENDIKIHIMGVSYNEENIYTIDITKGNKPSGLYNNDLENKVIGATNSMEWRFSDTEKWTSYATSLPNLTGDKTVQLRVGPTGTQLPSDAWTATFTDNNEPETRRYISIDNLSVHSVSSEATANGGHKEHAIDGNINTLWHSNYNGADTQKYIVIKLNEPKYISALEYIPRQSGTNGRVKDYVLSLSMDGSNWTEVSTGAWANNAATKVINLEESIEAEYVKLQAKTNYGDGRNFISAIMINLFEDKTGERPRGKVEYSTTTSTAKPVVATLKLADEAANITVIKPESGSKEYTFYENGEFTFEFKNNDNGKTGTAIARVNWLKNCEFSFDGDDKNKIVLSSKYAPTESDKENLVWEYSIDGGNTWVTIKNTLEIELSEEELEQVKNNSNIKLKVHITESVIGPDEYTVDITGGGTLPNDLYANDLENRIIGMTQDMEWRAKSEEGEWSAWTSCKTGNPTFIGNKTVEARYSATGTTKEGPAKTFTFTEDEVNSKKKYIPIEHLSLESYSTETDREGNREYARNALDGNINTMWHTNRTIADPDRYIVIKLDEPRFISHVQYVGKPNYVYGVLKEGRIDVSLDGATWTENVAEVHGEKYTSSKDLTSKYIQEFNFEKAVYAKYIRFKCTESYDYLQKAGADYFVNAVMLNLFENTDEVWEDTIPPKVSVSYSNTEATFDPVVVTMRFSEPVDILTENILFVQDEEDSLTYTYTFRENQSFALKYQDKAGNKGEDVNILVDWIKKEAPVAKVTYSISELTNQDVIATVTCDEPITITNNDGKDTYTFVENGTVEFEYINEDYSAGKVTAKVDWIDKVPPTAKVKYSTTEATNEDVVATIECNEEVDITNNDGKSAYTFTNNGEFTFEFKDKAGNINTATAKVDWIEKEEPSEKGSFETSLNSSKEEVKPGEEFEVSFNIKNIKNIKDGLIALIGKLEYDNKVLELLEIKGETDWSFDNNSYNEENFKFVTDNKVQVTEDGCVFKAKLKVKNIKDLPKEVEFKVKEIAASNGEIEVKAKDAKVTIKIVEDDEFSSEKYDIDNEYISMITPKTTLAELRENINTNQDYVIIDHEGNELKETDKIGTGMILKVGDKFELTLVVTGDTDGDADVGINDLARLKMHHIEVLELKDEYLKAADIDTDNKVTINDLALLKLVLIGKETIK